MLRNVIAYKQIEIIVNLLTIILFLPILINSLFFAIQSNLFKRTIGSCFMIKTQFSIKYP